MPTMTALVICLSALLPVSRLDAQTFKVGFTTRLFKPGKPYNWRGSKTEGLLTMIWYPAEAAATEQPQWIGPPGSPLFSAGKSAAGATVAQTLAKFPLVVLSHGTGGSALMLGWLGTGLASAGDLAAAGGRSRRT